MATAGQTMRPDRRVGLIPTVSHCVQANRSAIILQADVPREVKAWRSGQASEEEAILTLVVVVVVVVVVMVVVSAVVVVVVMRDEKSRRAREMRGSILVYPVIGSFYMLMSNLPGSWTVSREEGTRGENLFLRVCRHHAQGEGALQLKHGWWASTKDLLYNGYHVMKEIEWKVAM